jgi:hypothetical protein
MQSTPRSTIIMVLPDSARVRAGVGLSYLDAELGLDVGWPASWT